MKIEIQVNYQSYHAGLNAKIEAAVGDSSLIFKEADPDFEGILGLSGKNKVRQAIIKVRNLKSEEIPEVINNAIEKLFNCNYIPSPPNSPLDNAHFGLTPTPNSGHTATVLRSAQIRRNRPSYYPQHVIPTIS